MFSAQLPTQPATASSAPVTEQYFIHSESNEQENIIIHSFHIPFLTIIYTQEWIGSDKTEWQSGHSQSRKLIFIHHL